MSNNNSNTKIFRADDGKALGFSYRPGGRFPLVVDIQDRRGPRLYQMDEQEYQQLLAWLQAKLAVPVEQEGHHV